MEKVIGYVQIYFRVVGKKETCYFAFKGKMDGPVTKRSLKKLKRKVMNIYSQFDKIYQVDFCSEEEWRINAQKNPPIRINR